MEIEETGEATYCPEDNKLRLYVGRVPREEYLQLKKWGFKSTPKQDCDFVATWTTNRETVALAYGAGYIEDEDQSPADRAADRAERFSGYRDKRADEATGHADRYDNGPRLHGHQSAALAERRANAHDKIATRAVNQWGKAEYWQSRTAGVISHALHVSSPGVRMGRIKELESSLRKREKESAEYATKYGLWVKVLEIVDAEEAHKAAYYLANTCGNGWNYKHPRPENATAYVREHGTCIYSLMTDEKDPITGHEAAEIWLRGATNPETPDTLSKRWINHLQLRLAYENQMLEAQGGRAAHVEMIAGGWIGSKQIQKVNKSPATGRVTSVTILAPCRYSRGEDAGKLVLSTLKTERLPANAYRAPTDEELEKFKADKAAARKKAKATGPKKPSLINPTLEDAQKLQAIWNANIKSYSYNAEERTVIEMTQKQYSAYSKGSYGNYETVEITGGGIPVETHWSSASFPAVAKFRQGPGYGVVVITDKPQKAIPASVWDDPRPAVKKELRLKKSIKALEAGFISANATHYRAGAMNEEQADLYLKAKRVGWACNYNRLGWTDLGRKELNL